MTDAYRGRKSVTIYQLTFGAAGINAEQSRYFPADRLNDAATRFAELVMDYDRDPQAWAAYVHLNRLPDSLCPDGAGVLAWTKTSDERSTYTGAESAEELA